MIRPRTSPRADTIVWDPGKRLSHHFGDNRVQNRGFYVIAKSEFEMKNVVLSAILLWREGTGFNESIDPLEYKNVSRQRRGFNLVFDCMVPCPPQLCCGASGFLHFAVLLTYRR